MEPPPGTTESNDMKALTITLALVILTSCGGGDAQPGDMSFIGPPDCVNHAEACK